MRKGNKYKLKMSPGTKQALDSRGFLDSKTLQKAFTASCRDQEKMLKSVARMQKPPFKWLYDLKHRIFKTS